MVKHIRVIILAAVILALCTVTVGAYQAVVKKVVVIDNEVSKNYSTSVETVEKFLAEQNIEIKQYDELNLALNTAIEEGLVIKIDRAVPVSIIIDGSQMQVTTCRDTVAQLLEEKHVVLSDKDTVNYKVTDKISENMVIDIKTYQEVMITEKEAIAFATEKTEVYDLAEGRQNVIQEGINGEKTLTYKVIYVAGKETTKELVSETITKEPVNVIVQIGIKKPENIVNTPEGDLKYVESMIFNATAYTPREGGGNGRTATGMMARYGIVAVDPKVIPLYTKLYIEGYGVAIAADTGGSIKGNKIDLCYEDYNEAMDFGRRNVKVYILE
jgi:uncharacterized protein YabE (DUF348 family)